MLFYFILFYFILFYFILLQTGEPFYHDATELCQCASDTRLTVSVIRTESSVGSCLSRTEV